MESSISYILQDKGRTIHSIPSETTVYQCAQKLADVGVGALVVVDNGKLVGIVSERDIIRLVVKSDRDIKEIKVAEIMTREVVTVPPSMTVTAAMRLVTEKRIRHLPVTENDELVGIISIGDLTRWAMLAQQDEISTLTKYIHGDQ